MSYQRRCDVCDTKYGNYQIRKRWKIFQWRATSQGAYQDEIDFCDECFARFKLFVKDYTKEKNDGN